MLSRIRTVVVSLSVLAFLAVPAAVVSTPSPAFAAPQIDEALCQGANLQIDTALKAQCEDLKKGDGTATVNTLITQVINIISIVVAIVAVIMLIFGGFRYVTSGGASDKVKGAKDTILYALIGLVIVALAQTVVKFVVNKLTA
ncbi:MAG: pilin [Candidatus Saccharimonadales bacterium]